MVASCNAACLRAVTHRIVSCMCRLQVRSSRSRRSRCVFTACRARRASHATGSRPWCSATTATAASASAAQTARKSPLSSRTFCSHRSPSPSLQTAHQRSAAIGERIYQPTLRAVARATSARGAAARLLRLPAALAARHRDRVGHHPPGRRLARRLYRPQASGCRRGAARAGGGVLVRVRARVGV